MADRFTEGLFETADVVASTLAANGEIRVNVGDATRGTGIDSNIPFWGIDGFLSRPADPSSAGAAQYVFFRDGNQRYGFGSRDRRYLDQAGELAAGDRVIYSPSGLRILLDDSEEAFVLTTPGGSTLRFSDAGLEITLAGGASINLTDAEFDVSIPTAPLVSGFTIDANGIVLAAANLTQTIHLDAGSFVTLGLTAGLTRPSIVNVENVNIGPGGGLTIPAPKIFAASV